MEKIYFENPVLDKGLKEFLLDGFSIGKDIKKFKTTFQDDKLTLLQCNVARRSFKELSIIVNTYFPGVYTDSYIAKTLNSIDDLYILFCDDIEKIVFNRSDYTKNLDEYRMEKDIDDDEIEPVDDFYKQDYIDLLEQ